MVVDGRLTLHCVEALMLHSSCLCCWELLLLHRIVDTDIVYCQVLLPEDQLNVSSDILGDLACNT